MSVILGNTGITFPDATTQTTAAFPAGTRMSFQQTAAPTGWTKDTAAAINDAILRLVTGTVSSGGSVAFSTWNAIATTGAVTLATTQIPSHTHPTFTDVLASNGSGAKASGLTPLAQGYPMTNSGATGGGGSHSHSLSNNVKYYDFIIASKD